MKREKKQQTYEKFFTDEEGLARKTGWILIQKGKKRKAEQSSEMTTEKLRNEKDKLQINRKSSIIKKYKPLPVILSSIVEYPKLQRIMQESKIKYKANMLNNKQLKINVQVLALTEYNKEYRALTKAIKKSQNKVAQL